MTRTTNDTSQPNEQHTSSRIGQVEWGSQQAIRPLHWYVEGAIPAGAIVLIEGRKGMGKSTVTAALAAAVTGGPTFPGYCGPHRGRVIWSGAEDGWEDVILPRLKAAGADIERVGRLTPTDNRGVRRRPLLPDDLPLIEEQIASHGVELLVLDPYISLAGPEVDVRVEQQARLYLEPLADVMARHGAVAILTRHIRKGTLGHTLEAGLGSVGVGNLARGILRCDEHPHAREEFVLSVVALNYARRMQSQVYQMHGPEGEHPRVVWTGSSDLDAETIAEGRGDEAERGEWLDADRLLMATIGSGWVRVNVLMSEGERGGISSRMLRRAKERLGLPSRRVQVGHEAYWEWGPPSRGWPSRLQEMDQPKAPEGGHACAGAPSRPGAPKNPRKPRKKGQGAKAPPRTHAPPQAPLSNGEEVPNATD